MNKLNKNNTSGKNLIFGILELVIVHWFALSTLCLVLNVIMFDILQ